MIAVEPFVCNAFAQNTYIVYDEDRKEAFAVDAGMYEEAERLAFDRFLKQRQLTLKFLINTHLHLDHIFGNRTDLLPIDTVCRFTMQKRTNFY